MLNRIPAINEIVYHKDYGKGSVTYQDALWYYGVKFECGEECVHDSALYNTPIDKYGNPITDEINKLHENRTMLAVIDNKLIKKKASKQSHKDWFIEEKWIGNSSDTVFENIIRGYFDNTGIYFYKGDDFSTDESLELFVKHNITIIQSVIKLEGLNIYCGLIKGKPGEKFKPDKYICTI